MAGSAVLVFASIAGFSQLYASASHQTPVLTVSRTIQQGEKFTAADLGQASASIAGGVDPIAVNDASVLEGRVAAVTIPAGSLLTTGDIATAPTIPPGGAVVGLALRAGQLPAAGVDVGDQVMIVQTASPGTPLSIVPSGSGSSSGSGTSGGPTGILVAHATVYGVEPAPPNSAGSVAQLVSVEVSAALASPVSAAAAANQVSLVLLPAGSAPQSGTSARQDRTRSPRSGGGS